MIELPLATTPPVGNKPLFSRRQLILGVGKPVASQFKVNVSPVATVKPRELSSDMRGGIRTVKYVSAVILLVGLVTT